MSQLSTEADDLLKAMREVRAEPCAKKQQRTVNAWENVDLTAYVRAHPWLCVGAALAAGFLVVPQRSPIIPPELNSLGTLADNDQSVKKANAAAQKQSHNLLTGLLDLAANSLLQGGLAVFTKQLSQRPNSGGRSQSVSSDQGIPR
jgi:hypothetical protein